MKLHFHISFCQLSQLSCSAALHAQLTGFLFKLGLANLFHSALSCSAPQGRSHWCREDKGSGMSWTEDILLVYPLSLLKIIFFRYLNVFFILQVSFMSEPFMKIPAGEFYLKNQAAGDWNSQKIISLQCNNVLIVLLQLCNSYCSHIPGLLYADFFLH